jgi:Na+:H+ antiporter, NhaA family
MRHPLCHRPNRMRSEPVDAGKKTLSRTFNAFFDSEKSSGILLAVCTLIAIAVANSPAGRAYLGFWQMPLAGLTLEHWVNDALMAIFFLLIGLELEREIYVGELSNFRNALLPIFAAAGGMAAPALIHYSFNAGTAGQAGIGIPMATDIAFALGALALLGSRVPASLKVFVVAFAVIDDLGAVVLIAAVYTAKVSTDYLLGAVAVWALLLALNRVFRVMRLLPYLLGGAVMWFLMLKSGVHATVAGVMLAFAVPFSARRRDEDSPSLKLEHALQKPVAFVILPVFALANTGIVLPVDWLGGLGSANSVGIALGLVAGKPLGVVLLCYLAVVSGLCRLPGDLTWRHVIGAGMLGGIGFTMSIFITNLAFPSDPATITASKIAIFLASLVAGVLGFLWLRFCGRAA